jgi:hypothetical protein
MLGSVATTSVSNDCEGLDIQVSAKYGGKPQSTEVNIIGVPISRHPITAHDPPAAEPEPAFLGTRLANPVYSLKSFRCCFQAPPELCRAKLSDNE